MAQNVEQVKKDAETRMAKSVETLKADLGKVRTGRAHPGLLEGIRVDYYGNKSPLSQVASVAVGDARTLSQVLPAGVRDRFNVLLQKQGGSIAQFDPFEPWFVNLTLVVGLSQSMGFRGEDGLDQHLMRRAAAAMLVGAAEVSVEPRSSNGVHLHISRYHFP